MAALLRRSPHLVAAGAVASISVALLITWMAARDRLAVVFGDGAPTKPVTAFSLLVLSLLLMGLGRGSRLRAVPFALVGAIAAVCVVADLSGHSGHLGQAMLPESWRLATPDGNGRMALSTAVAVLAMSLALPLGRRRAASVLASLAFVLGHVGLLGHLYGVTDLYRLESETSMATVTAVLVMVLSAGILLQPGMPLRLLLADQGVSGSIARLLPGAVLLPAVLGWLQFAGQEAGLFGARYGLTVLVAAYALTTSIAVLLGARTAGRIDRARERAAEDLEALNAVLAERVALAVAEAEEGRERLRVLLDRTPVGIFETDPEGTRRYVNHRWREITGRDDSDPRGQHWLEAVHPEDRQWVSTSWQEALSQGHEWKARYRYLRPDGSIAWVETTAVTMRGHDGQVSRWLGSVVDVTAQVESEQLLRRSEEQFRLAMEHAPIGMAIIEVDGTFREANHALGRLLGYTEAELEGRRFHDVTHAEDLPAAADELRRLLRDVADHADLQQRFVTRDGEAIWAQVAVSLTLRGDGTPAYFVVQIQDISAAREEAQRLTHRALHDPLTGLPNRDLLMDHLSHALARSGRTGGRTAVMFCDLDGFKQVNDTHGHEVGDRLLVAIAQRLSAAVRPGDTVARLGGDEFVIVAEDIVDAAGAQALAERVRGELHVPTEIGRLVLESAGSIGVVVAGADDDPRSILREADAAMYRAKARGRDRVECVTLPKQVLTDLRG